jgi:hypothetical protein
MPDPRPLVEQLDAFSSQLIEGCFNSFNLEAYVKQTLAALGNPTSCFGVVAIGFQQLDIGRSNWYMASRVEYCGRYSSYSSLNPSFSSNIFRLCVIFLTAIATCSMRLTFMEMLRLLRGVGSRRERICIEPLL